MISCKLSHLTSNINNLFHSSATMRTTTAMLNGGLARTVVCDTATIDVEAKPKISTYHSLNDIVTRREGI